MTEREKFDATMKKMDFTFTNQLHYLIHTVDDEVVAHCLDMDLVGTGDTTDEAIEELNTAVCSLVLMAMKTSTFDIQSLCEEAPVRYWQLFEKDPEDAISLTLGSVFILECRR
jgi:hypothetical protein